MSIVAKFFVAENRGIHSITYETDPDTKLPDYSKPIESDNWKIALNPIPTPDDVTNKMLWEGVPQGRIELNTINSDVSKQYPLGAVVTVTIDLA